MRYYAVLAGAAFIGCVVLCCDGWCCLLCHLCCAVLCYAVLGLLPGTASCAGAIAGRQPWRRRVRAINFLLLKKIAHGAMPPPCVHGALLLYFSLGDQHYMHTRSTTVMFMYTPILCWHALASWGQNAAGASTVR